MFHFWHFTHRSFTLLLLCNPPPFQTLLLTHFFIKNKSQNRSNTHLSQNTLPFTWGRSTNLLENHEYTQYEHLSLSIIMIKSRTSRLKEVYQNLIWYEEWNSPHRRWLDRNYNSCVCVFFFFFLNLVPLALFMGHE